MNWAFANLIVDGGMNKVFHLIVFLLLVPKTNIRNRMPAVGTRRMLVA